MICSIWPGSALTFQRPARGEHRQLDVLADQPAEHLLHPGDALVQVQHLRLEHLLAAEREELPRQVRRALRRRPDLLDVGAKGLVGLEVAADQLRVAQDDGQQVVEVVRDAAGEPADGLHLLRLAELLLQSLSLGEVERQREPPPPPSSDATATSTGTRLPSLRRYPSPTGARRLRSGGPRRR